MAQRIALSFEEGLRKLVGVDFGRDTYQSQVKAVIDLSGTVTFVLPPEIDRVSSSFVQGFFEEIVREVGIDGVREQVALKASIDGLKEFVLENLD